jgi:diaminopimelate decarboxylase
MTIPLQFFGYEKGRLSTDGVSLAEIAHEVGTPVYIYSAEAFLSPLRELQKGLKDLDHLICFAVKSNSNIAIIKLLAEAGAGMDLVSGGELFRAKKAGQHASKMVFSGVGKTEAEMKMALELDVEGIFSFNVESSHELAVLNGVAVALKRKAKVALRFNPDVDAKTHPYISTGLKKNKFGMQRKEIQEVVKRLEGYPGIDLRGISIHIGSQLLTLAPLEDAFARLQKVVLELNEELPRPLSFVDLGGGVGIRYDQEVPPTLAKYCALVQKYFGKKAKLKYPLKVLIEPGRTLAGNAGVLVTEVLGRKQRTQKDFLVVDAGMNDLIRPALYESYHGIVPLNETLTKKNLRKTNIVGPVCESADCFATDRLFSTELKKGDRLAILSAGAYGMSMASNYNSRPRPAEVLVRNGKFRVIRKRETLEDLIRGEALE